jgi:hypothetical protein
MQGTMIITLHGYGKKKTSWSSNAPSNTPTTKITFGLFDLGSP